jgi:multimeric flavodoxin WrbA
LNHARAAWPASSNQRSARFKTISIIFKEKFEESDAIIIGAPTYLLGPAGIVKMLLDRNIMFSAKSPT